MRFCQWIILLCGIVGSLGAGRPNILWISCEDIGPHLGCYGYERATTPNLDHLAAEGVRYDRAFTVTGVCATGRASIITGMYASTLGNQFMRCSVDLPAHVRLFPQYFRDAGYYCTNNWKTDYNVTGSHKRCWDECGEAAHWRTRKDKQQPFFAVINLTNTHESKIFDYKRPQNLTDDELHDPDNMQVPPYYPDTRVSRTDWAHNFDNITSMDKLAAGILRQLDEDGLSDDTIVFFWSDHGVGLPRAKRWIYDSGTHVPFIVRIPPKFRRPGQGEPGTVCDELVSTLDLAPTIMNLAGLPIPEHFQGRAFLGDNLTPPRQYVFMIRDRMDERYDLIRSVRDSRYRYIRNFQPYKPYAQVLNYMEQEHTMQELRRLHAAGELTPEAARFMADRKPLEELYDLQADPHEVHNLVDEVDERPELKTVLEGLRNEQRQWIFDTRDTGLIPESELEVRGRQLGTRYDVLQSSDAKDLLKRLLATNRLACAPTGHESQLIAASRDADAAVRYWAMIGLANLSSDSAGVRSAIRQTLADESGAVRLAAARASWQIGLPAAALPVIRKAATSGEEFLALMAMHLIDDMNDDATPVWDVVTWVQHNQPGYPARVAQYLLDD